MLAEETDATNESGTDSTGYCDKLTKSGTALRAVRFGGNTVGVGGVFSATANPATNAYTTGCVRLAYHHY